MTVLEKLLKERKELSRDMMIDDDNQYRVLINDYDCVRAFYFSVPIYTKMGQEIKSDWQSGETLFHEGINCTVQRKDHSIIIHNRNLNVEICLFDKFDAIPTLNGAMIKVKAKSIEFMLKGDVLELIKQNGKCISFMKEYIVPYLTIDTLWGRRGNSLDPLIISCEKVSDKECNITISCEKDCEEIFFQINAYSQKLLLDTTVESNNSIENNAFGGVSFVGNTELFGEQRVYTRLNQSLIRGLWRFNIKKAILYIPFFCSEEVNFSIYCIENNWCSFNLNWENKKTEYNNTVEYEISRGFLKINVTKILRANLRLRNPSNYSFVILNNARKASIICTGDNYAFPSMLEVELCEM